jgi:hypothetical protein
MPPRLDRVLKTTLPPNVPDRLVPKTTNARSNCDRVPVRPLIKSAMSWTDGWALRPAISSTEGLRKTAIPEKREQMRAVADDPVPFRAHPRGA